MMQGVGVVAIVVALFAMWYAVTSAIDGIKGARDNEWRIETERANKETEKAQEKKDANAEKAAAEVRKARETKAAVDDRTKQLDTLLKSKPNPVIIPADIAKELNK